MPLTRVGSQDIKDGAIVNADIASGAAIDASKIADGSVSNAEFQRLDGVTANIQTQFDGRVRLDPTTSAQNTIKPISSPAVVALTVDAAAFTTPGSLAVFRVRGLTNNDSFVVTESHDGSAYSTQIDVFRATAMRLNNGCKLDLEDTDGSHAISLAVPNITANYTLTLPAVAGSNGHFLTTTGSGTLVFTAHDGTGDPHTQYVALTPVAGARNVIQAATDEGALSIHADASNTTPIATFEVFDRTGQSQIAVIDDASPYVLLDRPRTSNGITLGTGASRWVLTHNATGSTGTFAFRFPNNGQGSNGQILSTDGAGNTTWINPSAGVAGSDTQVQFNDGGSAFGGDTELTWNKTTNVLTVGAAAVAGHVSHRNQGEARFYEANAGGANYAALRAPAAINADFTLTLPADAGASGQVLRTDGTGVLTWVSNVSSLNGLTAGTQTFAKVDDTNVTLAINSATSTHTLTLGWTGTLAISRGGTGQSTKTAAYNALSPNTSKGDIVVHDGTNNLRLPIGTTGQFLGVNGATTAAWASFSTVAHSSLGSLTSGDDHTQYIYTSPANGARNIINAAADALGLTINANGSSVGSHAILSVGNMLEVRATAAGARERVDVSTIPFRLISGASLAFVSGANTMSFTAPGGGFTGSFTLALPTSAGTSGQFLQTNGSNTLTWASALASLNGLTAGTQTFAKVDDTNVTLAINSATSTHTLTLGWTGALAISRGGTGQTAKTAAFDALAPTTTKADIAVHNGTNNVRLPVGSNNQVLTADSSQTTGLKWASVSTSASFVDNEIPTGTINGVNAVFTLASTPVAGSVHLYKNGMRMTPGTGNDFTISGSTITFESGAIPLTNDTLLADYRI